MKLFDPFHYLASLFLKQSGFRFQYITYQPGGQAVSKRSNTLMLVYEI